MKDRQLLLELLQKAKLSDGQREFFGRELAKVESMGLKLNPVNRRHAEAIARVNGIIPSNMTTYSKQTMHLNASNDVYSTVVTKGTEIAAAIVAWQDPKIGVMPTPPIRRKAS